jgi:hypothetical protein
LVSTQVSWADTVLAEKIAAHTVAMMEIRMKGLRM